MGSIKNLSEWNAERAIQLAKRELMQARGNGFVQAAAQSAQLKLVADRLYNITPSPWEHAASLAAQQVEEENITLTDEDMGALVESLYNNIMCEKRVHAYSPNTEIPAILTNSANDHCYNVISLWVWNNCTDDSNSCGLFVESRPPHHGANSFKILCPLYPSAMQQFAGPWQWWTLAAGHMSQATNTSLETKQLMPAYAYRHPTHKDYFHIRGIDFNTVQADGAGESWIWKRRQKE